MKNHIGSIVLFAACCIGFSFAPVSANAEDAAAKPQTATLPQPTWGRIVADDAVPSRLLVHVAELSADSDALQLPTPFANIVAAYRVSETHGVPRREPIAWSFNQDASQIALHLPIEVTEHKPLTIALEIAEKSQQFADGRIVFSALDATVALDKTSGGAKLETHPGNHRIGFWTDAADSVSWPYHATRPGTYAVELVYSKAGDASDKAVASAATEIEITYAGATLTKTIAATGSWSRYRTVPIGKLYVEKSGKQELAVRCTKLTGGAVMNLKAIILRPATEGDGDSLKQSDDGTVVLHSRDSTIDGVLLRYEPQPHKNTVGYWANAADGVHWDFEVTEPGRFEVVILQGCGEGQGGSAVEIALAGVRIPFVVEDTGHFQNFKPRNVGSVDIAKAGRYRLGVNPIRKAKGAVMDLRQVTLRRAGAE